MSNTNSSAVTLLDAYDQLCTLDNVNKRKQNNVATALFRYYAKGLEGKKTAKARFTEKMLTHAKVVVSRVQITDEFKRDEQLAILEKGFDLLEAKDSTRNPSRSHFKFLLNYVEQTILGSTKKAKKSKSKKVYLIKDKIVDKSYLANHQPKRKQNDKIILSLDVSDHLERFSNKYPHLTENQALQEVSNQIGRLKSEIDGWNNWYVNSRGRQITFNKYKQFILRLLGWLYLTDKELTIEDINLTSLIKPINIRVDRHAYNYNLADIYYKEGELRDEEKDSANFIIKFLKNFFLEYSIPGQSFSKGYAICFITSLESLCKYLYKDIVGFDFEYSYDDLLVIKYLKKYSKEIKDSKQFKPKQKKQLFLNWEEIKLVHSALKIDADEDYYYKQNKNGKQKGIIHREKKLLRQKIKHFQNFLLFSCFVVIPPDRQRTMRELEYNRTLRYGVLDNNGFLKDLDPTQDKSGLYYICQTPDDHKTGSKKNTGRMLPFINEKFEDGSCFNDYMTRWLFELRPQANPDCNTIFFGDRKKESLDSYALRGKIGALVRRKTGIHINIHAFRNIFITYQANKGATHAERVAHATYMNHSLEMQQNVYNNQTDLDKIKPLLDEQSDEEE